MKEPTYQQALSAAWQVVWHHKALWILGLLAACLGQFGLGDFFGRLWFLYNHGTVAGFYSEYSTSYGLAWSGDVSWVNVVGLVWLVGLVLVILIAVIFLTVTAQGALIAYSTAWFKNKSYTSVAKAWDKSVKHFWSMLWIVFVYKFLFILLLASTVLLLKFSDKAGVAWVNFLLGITIGAILFFYLVFSIIYIYALGYVVVENNKAKAAAQKAWQLLSRHILVSLEVGVILMFLNLILFIAIVSSILLALLPAVVIWIAAGILKLTSLAAFGFFLAGSVWILLVVLMAAVFNAFNTSTWMYMFTKMHKQGVVSRVAHYFGRLFKKA